jgi:hypothetical protein
MPLVITESVLDWPLTSEEFIDLDVRVLLDSKQVPSMTEPHHIAFVLILSVDGMIQHKSL